MVESIHALSLAGISKYYGDFPAVDGVSFDLGRGEFLTMLGPSGSGKTTTLRLIAGFLRADHGAIMVGGKDVSPIPAHKRNIGIVFQNYALFPHLTAARNVAFPLEARGVGRRNALRRAREALELVGLHDRGDRRPTELSGGQQQRVALARAIVFQPDLLLMDEPLGALDRKLRQSMQIEIMRVARETEATVISVTHDQEEALVMSDRIAIFNHGRIEQIGSAQELYEQPASVFVADFIGESNIFRAQARADGGLRGPDWVGHTAHAGAAGQVCLVLRPEQLRLMSFGAETEANRRPAIVSEAIYLGSEWRYLLELSGGERAVARVPREDVTEPLAPGSPVTVCWSARAGVVLRADETPMSVPVTA